MFLGSQTPQEWQCLFGREELHALCAWPPTNACSDVCQKAELLWRGFLQVSPLSGQGETLAPFMPTRRLLLALPFSAQASRTVLCWWHPRCDLLLCSCLSQGVRLLALREELVAVPWLLCVSSGGH